jgi:hypothetical protein
VGPDPVVCRRMGEYVCKCVCVCVCVDVCMYACVCVCVRIYHSRCIKMDKLLGMMGHKKEHAKEPSKCKYS